jgi:glucosyl-dolichyl phosphate glucuronosyltransferase
MFPTGTPIISVVMPTRNRLEDIKASLPSLREQDIHGVDWELIIVDNGSIDGTEAWCGLQVGGVNPRVRYVCEPAPGLLSGRHRGAMEAKGHILTFIDDDIQALPGWLRAIYSGFDDPEVALVGGPSRPNYESEPPEWMEEFWTTTPCGGRTCGFLSLIDLGPERLVIEARYIYGLNFSIRRDALRALGGFHPDGVPSDLLRYRGDGETGLAFAAERSGFKAVYEPGAAVLHKVPADRMTLEYFEKRAYSQGVSDSYTRARRLHGLSGRPQRSILRGLRRRLGAAGRLVKSQLRPLWNDDVPVVTEAKHRIALAYERGVAFHQDAMLRDPAVRDWVLRPDYWDYALPT